jgi:hypothetical protein
MIGLEITASRCAGFREANGAAWQVPTTPRAIFVVGKSDLHVDAQPASDEAAGQQVHIDSGDETVVDKLRLPDPRFPIAVLHRSPFITRSQETTH